MRKLKGAFGVGLPAAALFVLFTCAHCTIKDVISAPPEAGGAGGEATDTTPGGAPNDGGTSNELGGTPGSDAGAGGAGGALSTAGAGGEAPVPVSGDHYGYVIDSLKMPASGNEASEAGFDLDGDGKVDNRFGQAMVSFATQGFDINGAIETAILNGDTILLGDLQATALTAAKGAAFATYFGDDPMPAACATAADCGKHLSGLASFTLAASPAGKACEGSLAASVFTCRGGSLPIRFSIGATVDLTLRDARVELSDVTKAGFPSGRLGGSISEKDVNDHIYPAIQSVIQAALAKDCKTTGAPSCGCTASSAGASYITLLDANHDCAVPLAEIKANSLFASLLAPDLDLDHDDSLESLSCAFTVSGKSATFELP
jgi:hypothetical protein